VPGYRSGSSGQWHCAAGLDRPSSGRVWLGDEELSRKRETALTEFRREHVGFVFQAYNLLGWLTAVKRTGQTTVMVTHDPVAASFADSVVFLWR
jgi:putative ABC transport system ATP-binding protein